MDVVDEVLALLAERGGSQYGGEAVTQLAHALQCASLAERSGAAPAVIAAALLHDLGHLLPGTPGRGGDRRHEEIAERFLADRFNAAVVGPVRLHVAAKRYLCTAEPGYADGLSPASVRSLALQGGPFSPTDAVVFTRQPHAAAAISLRRWDDAAKEPDAVVPGLGHFRCYLEACVIDRSGS